MIRLTGVEGVVAGKTFELDSAEVVIGRSRECALPVDDPRASRRHARIFSTPEGDRIEDLGSGNGTYVNGQRLLGPALLADQDSIRIASQVFKYCAGPGGGRASGLADMDGAAIEGTLQMGGMTLMQPGAGDARKANERLRLMLRISEALQSELELDTLLGRVLDSLFEVFPQADRGFLMLYDNQGELKPAKARNRQGQAEQITISRKIVAEATEKRVALLSSDAMGDSRFQGAMSIVNFQIRSMMCAPLVSRDQLLGVLHVDTSRQGRRFNQDDLELLTGVAAQTAQAIASAKMHERLLLRDRMERDLKIAMQVQTSFLPRRLPEVEGLEFAAFYRAAQEIGGDLYDVIRTPQGQVAVVVGDVSGKGIPAALMMARMSADVRFCSAQSMAPGRALAYINDLQAENDMADVFVTMAFVSVDPGSRRMVVGNAGHLKPLVRRAADGSVEEAGQEPGFPLGVAGGVEYEEGACALQPGDVVCLV
ncbi:MAG TPA: SpoIIE family protein phosphatase, partial [Candidatus Brocadiia bacterium]|nr:SpoIIE family protein phosphatase [Candidatus Brocadiia bacterium]